MKTIKSCVHGDFWFGNLLLHEHQVSGVVDWEMADLCGEPLRDLARFAISYALYLDRHTQPGHRVSGHPGLRAGEFGEGIAYAIEGTGWFPALFRGFLQQGITRLGGDPRLWREVALAAIAEVAGLADHEEFALHHLLLFDRLTQKDRILEVEEA
jgi:aminoglycoside phosphotransferase (APT) family kinase protein